MTSKAICLRGLMTKLGFVQQDVVKVLCDNVSAIENVKHLVFHERTKHIEIVLHSIRNKVKEEVIALQHILSKDQIANIV